MAQWFYLIYKWVPSNYHFHQQTNWKKTLKSESKQKKLNILCLRNVIVIRFLVVVDLLHVRFENNKTLKWMHIEFRPKETEREKENKNITRSKETTILIDSLFVFFFFSISCDPVIVIILINRIWLIDGLVMVFFYPFWLAQHTHKHIKQINRVHYNQRLQHPIVIHHHHHHHLEEEEKKQEANKRKKLWRTKREEEEKNSSSPSP